MAIDDLPLPVVNFLNVIGVPWPYIDEDMVLQFAALARDFGQAVKTTHEEAALAIAGIAESHQGASTQLMTSRWARMSEEHVEQLVLGCEVLAVALDVAAGYIVVQKAEAIAILIGMAEAFIADQAAAVATLGIAEAAVPVLIEGAQLLVKSLVMTLEQHIIGEVIEAAAKPLFAKVQAAMAELDWSKSAGANADAAKPTGFSVNPELVRAHVASLRSHAATMLSHGERFQVGVRALAF